jgi:hypothetical protein
MLMTTNERKSNIGQWAVFVDNYDVSIANIVKLFARLNESKDLFTQRQHADDLEQELFECRQQIVDIENQFSHFHTTLIDRAVPYIANCKNELDYYYSMLLAYQRAHWSGTVYVFPHQDFPNFYQQPELITDSANSLPDPTWAQTNGHHVDPSTQFPSLPSSDDVPALRPLTDVTQSPYHAYSDAEWEQRELLLDTHEINERVHGSIDRTSDAIRASTIYGTFAAQSLHQQRESLTHQRQVLQAIGELVQRSGHTLNRMRRRILTDKLLQFLIILMECLLIILIVYFKYYR